MIIAESVPREAHNRFTDNFQTDNLIFIELSQLLSGKGLRGSQMSWGGTLEHIYNMSVAGSTLQVDDIKYNNFRSLITEDGSQVG